MLPPICPPCCLALVPAVLSRKQKRQAGRGGAAGRGKATSASPQAKDTPGDAGDGEAGTEAGVPAAASESAELQLHRIRQLLCKAYVRVSAGASSFSGPSLPSWKFRSLRGTGFMCVLQGGAARACLHRLYHVQCTGDVPTDEFRGASKHDGLASVGFHRFHRVRGIAATRGCTDVIQLLFHDA